MTAPSPSHSSAAGPPPWHSLVLEAVLVELQAPPHGLDDAAAAARLVVWGPNTLPSTPPPTLFTILLHQFASPLIYILLAAAALAVAVGDWTDAGFILVVVLLNASLGAFQEWRAERSAASLQQLLGFTARVTRNRVEGTLPAEALVPGDLVSLESGNRVPADLRLIEANQLEIDESFLTGESQSVAKALGVLSAETPVSERRNLAFAGSTVVTGRARGVVVATGMRTEVGGIVQSVAGADVGKPPLLIRMERFAHQISLGVLGAIGVLALIALARGMAWLDVFLLAVALAVSAIPEGLPVAITVALSLATARMAARKVIVRRLTAVEGLGSCTLIATDKTGTLTVNRQTVRLVALPGGTRASVSGEGYAAEGQVTAESGAALTTEALGRTRRLARAGVICNEASLRRHEDEWQHHGDAVDVALLTLSHKLGLDPDAVRGGIRVLGAIPFESARSFAATFYTSEGRAWVAVKGAAEVVLPRCDTEAGPEGLRPIEHSATETDAVTLAGGGFRCLVVAEAEVSGAPDRDGWSEADLPPLTLLGLIGLIDPPRPEAAEAVAQCRSAGIVVAMVTGDHPATALAIARAVGITTSDAEVISGRELARLGAPTHRAYMEAIRDARVFARVTPAQKLDIVDALIRQGHFVAVTGDGVNDAPALRAAHIGIAMGSGSDVAKDTAEIIVADDNFASIEAGVEEGRFAYANVRKVTYLLISTGVAEVLVFTLALGTGLPLPLLPVQLLWLNLVTNGIQDVALAFEGGEPGVMREPPRRPAEGVFNRQMILQTLVAGGVMGLLVFVNWQLLLGAGFEEAEARSRLLVLFVVLQNFHVFNCRSESTSAFRVPLRRNPILVLGVLGALGVHLGAMHLPLFQRLLGTGPIALAEWLVPLVMGASVLMSMELFKLWRARR